MGKNYVNGKTFLEKRYDDKIELEDAVHTAILTLKEGFEGQVCLLRHKVYFILKLLLPLSKTLLNDEVHADMHYLVYKV